MAKIIFPFHFRGVRPSHPNHPWIRPRNESVVTVISDLGAVSIIQSILIIYCNKWQLVSDVWQGHKATCFKKKMLKWEGYIKFCQIWFRVLWIRHLLAWNQRSSLIHRIGGGPFHLVCVCVCVYVCVCVCVHVYVCMARWCVCVWGGGGCGRGFEERFYAILFC